MDLPGSSQGVVGEVLECRGWLVHTIAIVKEHLIAFIYGRNDQLSKYIGVFEVNGNQFDWRAALIRYMMPSRNYTLFFIDEPPEELFNERKEMVIPLRPLNKPFFKLCINSKMIPLPPFMKKWISVKMCEVAKKEWKQGHAKRMGTSRSMAKTVKRWYKHKNRSSSMDKFAA